MDAKHREGINLALAKFICRNLLDHSSKPHAYTKGGKAPMKMYGKEIGQRGGIPSDPGEPLKIISREWQRIWGCDDPDKVAQAASIIRAARGESLNTANLTLPTHGSEMKGGASRFNSSTSNGANHWTLLEFSTLDGIWTD